MKAERIKEIRDGANRAKSRKYNTMMMIPGHVLELLTANERYEAALEKAETELKAEKEYTILLQKRNHKTIQGLALANSMILSGESHSETSRKEIDAALKPEEKVPGKSGN